jgi:hypothetical protein
MQNFETLCVTIHQTDFSKIRSMNIHSNVIFDALDLFNKKGVSNRKFRLF